MNFVDWLGFKRKPCWEKYKRQGAFFGCVLKIVGVIICAITLFIFFGSLYGMVYATIGFIYGDQTGDYRYIPMFLAFMIGAPFLAWRSHTAQVKAEASYKQNEIALNGQIIESISSAVASLGMVRDNPDDKSKQGINIEVRIGAIYALQRISNENYDFHIQVMKILCAYIKSNAKRGEKNEYLRDDIHTALEVIRERSKDAAKIERENHYCPNLSGADLSSADKSVASLSDADVSSADKSVASLSDAGLNDANLRNADLIGANLSCADLSGADLSGANLSCANLSFANLSGANLRDADLSDADLSDANLSRANLSFADLRNANLRDADLRNANLWNANLSDADLRNANLSRADLSGANLRNANLSRADLSDADLIGANLSDANLRNANLSDADLSDANLSRADLRNANLRNANLSPDALIGAKLGSEVISEERANALHRDWGCIFPDDLE